MTSKIPPPGPDDQFKIDCEAANVNISKRQRKKWDKKKGIAYRVSRGEATPLPPGHMHQGGKR